MVRIDGERLLRDLRELRTFGGAGTGVVRPTYSDADMAARRWLRSRMEAAGLDAVVDGMGNVIGRSPNAGPAVIVGSHSDTQPTGGWLDGALGVVYGLEVARALLEDAATRHLAVDAVAWVDEEATYFSCLGSKSYFAVLDLDQAHAAANAAGETVRDARERLGLLDVATGHYDPNRHVAYLEAHIEQGPHLEDRGDRIGVVTGIVGLRANTVVFHGEQNHAGTTPMDRRADAGVALFDFAVRLRDTFGALAGPATVWTIGRVRLEPGAESIVPGRAELVLQYRDPDADRLERMEDALAELAAACTRTGPVEIDVTRDRHPMPPTVMDPSLIEHLETAAEAVVPGQWRRMPSAAIHDAMVGSARLPCGMVFIPSIGGVSHDAAEDSLEADIVTGCEVLSAAVASVLVGR